MGCGRSKAVSPVLDRKDTALDSNSDLKSKRDGSTINGKKSKKCCSSESKENSGKASEKHVSPTLLRQNGHPPATTEQVAAPAAKDVLPPVGDNATGPSPCSPKEADVVGGNYKPMENTVNTLFTPELSKLTVTQPLLVQAPRPHMSASQAEFFRVLDAKIDEGTDYEPDGDEIYIR